MRIKIEVNFIPLAMFILKRAMKDEAYRYSWQANIAMAIYDEYIHQSKFTDNEEMNFVHKVANNGAINFLNTLVRKQND